MVFSFVTILFCFAGTVYTLPAHDADKALWYMQKLGLLEKTLPGELTGYESASSAISDLKKSSGQLETDELNSDTIAMMNIPRCGLIDKENRNGFEGSTRSLTGLAYHIKKYPVNAKDVAKVGQEIAKAFKIWRDLTESCFKEDGLGRLDININFDTTENGGEKSSAHTFFPKYDSADMTETQTADEKTNIKSVDITEEKIDSFSDISFGGIMKNTSEEIMENSVEDIFTFMKKQSDPNVAQTMEYKSHEDEEVKGNIAEEKIDRFLDISSGNTMEKSSEEVMVDSFEAIMENSSEEVMVDSFEAIMENSSENIFTFRKKQSVPMVAQAMKYKSHEDEEVKEPIHAPDICEDPSLDTITVTEDGSTYAFKGDYCWKIYFNATVDGYPRRIADDFVGLEGNLDASFTAPDGKTYFFKGSHYWRFTNKKMDGGYPKLISEEFKGIPDDLDAALTWGKDRKTYFFKGDQYWRYDADEYPHVKDEYPKSITDWRGIPTDGIDAAFLWENNASYFFKGGIYYRFDDRTFAVSKHFNYPASIGYEWFSCLNRR